MPIIKFSSRIDEMSNIIQTKSGLSENVVMWFAKYPTRHGLRIKISNVAGKFSDNNFTLTIPDFKIIGKVNKSLIDNKLLDEIKEWITGNLDIIEMLNDEKIKTKDFVDNIKSISDIRKQLPEQISEFLINDVNDFEEIILLWGEDMGLNQDTRLQILSKCDSSMPILRISNTTGKFNDKDNFIITLPEIAVKGKVKIDDKILDTIKNWIQKYMDIIIESSYHQMSLDELLNKLNIN